MILRPRLIILLAGVIGAVPSVVVAQQRQDDTPSVVEIIEEESEGRITIDIPPEILQLILEAEEKPSQHQHTGNKTGYNKANGYRIQVFSDGRNQHSLESRAKARGNAILAKFPKYRGQIYSYSASPNWYTRVGNFRSANEANQALAELKSAFPGFASEMRVVKTQIVVLK